MNEKPMRFRDLTAALIGFVLASILLNSHFWTQPLKGGSHHAYGAPVKHITAIDHVDARRSIRSASLSADSIALVRQHPQYQTAAEATAPHDADQQPQQWQAPFNRSKRGLPSDRWMPYYITRCEPGMPPEYAPCLNYTNLQAAQEVIYPDFRIRHPKYLQPELGHIISAFLKDRFRHDKHWHYYLNQHGRNLVFNLTSYRYDPPPVWAAGWKHCMSGRPANHQQFASEAAVQAATKAAAANSTHESVMFAAAPDSDSFQHWMDRVAMMLVQTEGLRSSSTKYIAHQPKSPAVTQSWQYLANVTQLHHQLLTPGQLVAARSFIFACDTPLVHPYLAHRVSEDALAAAGLDPRGRPLEERKAVLLMTRMEDGDVHNKGRRWLNHQECRSKIQQLLDARGQGEYIEQWENLEFPNYAAVMKYFSTKVRAMVGPHGGAFYNLFYATSPTTVLEIWPVSPSGKRYVPSPNLFFELSHVRDLQYWALPATSDQEHVSNVHVNCSAVVEVLSRSLGQTYEPVLERFYQGTTWSA